MTLLLALALTPDASALTLSPWTPLRVGAPNTTVATDAVAGHPITFMYGLVGGNTPVPGCQGLTVPIAAPTIAGTVVAGATGIARLTGYWPASMSGRTVHVVAIDPTSCTTSNVTSYAVPLVEWADVEPIFATSCASGCHWHVPLRSARGGFSLGGPGDMVDVPSNELPEMDRIEPFDPTNSYVWHKLEGSQLGVGGAGERMPLGGPSLSPQQVDLIEAWIMCGALP